MSLKTSSIEYSSEIEMKPNICLTKTSKYIDKEVTSIKVTCVQLNASPRGKIMV